MRRTRVLFLVMAALVVAGCLPGRVVYGSGPYRGRVVDAETKRPLAGAAVVAVWKRDGAWLVGPEGPRVAYFDAVEVVTNAQGEFEVPAKTHVTLIGWIREPDFSVYAPGYVPFPHLGTHPQGDVLESAYQSKVFEFQLPRVTAENERRYASHPTRLGGVPLSKTPITIDLINQEKRRLGLQPIPSPRERSPR
jgi:hypothetical protein